MNNIIRILILAIIGGLIGYITNVIAIKLIFRPINPIKIPIQYRDNRYDTKEKDRNCY